MLAMLLIATLHDHVLIVIIVILYIFKFILYCIYTIQGLESLVKCIAQNISATRSVLLMDNIIMVNVSNRCCNQFVNRLYVR